MCYLDDNSCVTLAETSSSVAPLPPAFNSSVAAISAIISVVRLRLRLHRLVSSRLPTLEQGESDLEERLKVFKF